MALFAERTSVPTDRSRAQIDKLLERHGARKYGTSVDYGRMLARVQFAFHDRIVRFTIALPNPEKFRSVAIYEQAVRQRWRALLLVIKAKLESVENQIATFEEEFMAHIVLPNDRTVGEIVLPQIAAAYTTGRMPKALNPAPEDA